jgi:hypothetical protein
MSERLAHHSHFAEPLQWSCQCEGTWKESKTSNSRRSPPGSCRSNRSLCPLQQRLDRNAAPSIHSHPPPCTTRGRFGRNRQKFSRFLEEVRRDHTSHTAIRDTSFGSVVKARVYPGPGQQNVSVSIIISRFATSGCGTCLVYHIDKRLRAFPNEGTDGVTHIVARENGFDQGGEFVRSECACDQTLPGWGSKLGKKANQGQSVFHARRRRRG